jgi:hypothetical protein
MTCLLICGAIRLLERPRLTGSATRYAQVSNSASHLPLVQQPSQSLSAHPWSRSPRSALSGVSDPEMSLPTDTIEQEAEKDRQPFKIINYSPAP